MTYEEASAYLAEVPKFTKKNTPENTKELLRRLGRTKPAGKVVHVAGTNGKGSVCAFMESALRRAGYRTGLFTSPPLVRINERFQVNREEISDEDFAEIFTLVKGRVDEMVREGWAHPAYFELLYAVGMEYFARQETEYLVLETGMGGRLDATSLAEPPAVCVITSISLDHTQYLGDTVEQIAGEKAGIIREGVPVIYDTSDPAAAAVIGREARRLHAPAYPFDSRRVKITDCGEMSVSYVLDGPLFNSLAVTVPSPALYQAYNSALALYALRIMDPQHTVPDSALAASIACTRWGGRMEMVLPGVVVDGAHNAEGIRQFMETVVRTAKKKPVSLLFAAVADKEYEEMIRRICTEGKATSVVVTQISGSRMVDAHVFAALFRRYTDVPVEAYEDVGEAFARALELRRPDGILFCAGSLYLVGEIKALLHTK